MVDFGRPKDREGEVQIYAILLELLCELVASLVLIFCTQVWEK